MNTRCLGNTLYQLTKILDACKRNLHLKRTRLVVNIGLLWDGWDAIVCGFCRHPNRLLNKVHRRGFDPNGLRIPFGLGEARIDIHASNIVIRGVHSGLVCFATDGIDGQITLDTQAKPIDLLLWQGWAHHFTDGCWVWRFAISHLAHQAGEVSLFTRSWTSALFEVDLGHCWEQAVKLLFLRSIQPLGSEAGL